MPCYYDGMKTLLRYPGGKAKAIKVLSQYVPQDTKKVVSPFFGGGSFEFYLSEQGIEVEGYDIFKPVVNFWKVVKSASRTCCVYS